MRELNKVLNIIYLPIYARLMVCIQLYLTYSKGYALYIKSTYSKHTNIPNPKFQIKK